MGYLKLDHLPPLSPLRVAHSKYRKDHTLPKEQAPPGKVTIYLQVWTDQEGRIIRVDAYALNNPLKYTDPTGEYVNFVIGAVVGGFSGFMIGQAKGASGWGLLGYTLGGATIGAASAGVGTAVGGAVAGSSFAGASATGAVVGGASSGAFSGAGFAALGGGNIGRGALYGGIAGAAGGFVGGAVGGAPGAFAGGATAGGVGTALYGGSSEQIAQSVLIGGAIGLGSYAASSYYNYKTQYQGDLRFGAYMRTNAAIGRANFWEAEASWYELADGSISKIRYGSPFGGGVNPAKPVPAAAVYEAHTHPRYGQGFEYFGKTDILNYQAEGNPSGLAGYKVYGYKNVYTLSVDKASSLTGLNPNWSPVGYKPWAISNGLNIGATHGFSLYSHNLFWFGR